MGCVDPNSSDTNQIRNIWTLEQHVAAAFRNGRVQIQQEWDIAECSDDNMQATCQVSSHVLSSPKFTLTFLVYSVHGDAAPVPYNNVQKRLANTF